MWALSLLSSSSVFPQWCFLFLRVVITRKAYIPPYNEISGCKNQRVLITRKAYMCSISNVPASRTKYQSQQSKVPTVTTWGSISNVPPRRTHYQSEHSQVSPTRKTYSTANASKLSISIATFCGRFRRHVLLVV